MDNKKKLGFIGLGLMGSPMTERLLKAGYEVTVWNRNPSKTNHLVEQGAHPASDITQLVNRCEVVMLCVSNTEAVQDVVFKKGGVCDAATAEHIVVDFSSIDPQTTRQFSEQLHQRTEAFWVDAPVSGGVAGAESGNLVIMAGGDRTIINALQPVFNVLSQRVTHMGPVGSGQTTKVCNQMLVSCNVLVMAEVLALAEQAGVDSTKIPSALKGGFADSIPFQLTGSRMVNRDFDEIKWHVKTLLKDLGMAKSLSESLASYTPMAELAEQLMTQYSVDGYAEKDPSTLIECYLKP